MTEFEEQRDFVARFREIYPNHAPALRVSLGGIFMGKGREGAIRMSKAKALGFTTGEVDIFIGVPRGTFHGLYIEHKAAGQPHKVSDEQQEALDYHRSMGFHAISTRGLPELNFEVDSYMALI